MILLKGSFVLDVFVILQGILYISHALCKPHNNCNQATTNYTCFSMKTSENRVRQFIYGKIARDKLEFDLLSLCFQNVSCHLAMQIKLNHENIK